MRLLFAPVFLFALTSLACAQIDIRRVWPEYRTPESFDRISEYFTKKENTTGQTILRTQADERGGYYFLVRVKNAGAAVADATVQLNVVTPTSPRAKTYTFTAPIAAGANILNIGLTGKDWGAPATNPVAWEVRLVAADGRELARKESFLWAKSDTPAPSPEPASTVAPAPAPTPPAEK